MPEQRTPSGAPLKLKQLLFEEPRVTPESGLASLPFFTYICTLILGLRLTGASQRTHTWQNSEMNSELNCNHTMQTYAIIMQSQSHPATSCFNQARFAHLQPPGVPCRPNPGCNVWGMPPPHLSCHPKNDVDNGVVDSKFCVFWCFLENCSLIFLLAVLWSFFTTIWGKVRRTECNGLRV